jgi:hypothetical protein
MRILITGRFRPGDRLVAEVRLDQPALLYTLSLRAGDALDADRAH